MSDGAQTRLVVPQKDQRQRLDTFLASSGLIMSRSQAKTLIDAGHVLVEGERRKAGYMLHPGEKVYVDIPPPAPSAAQPEPLELNVVYEDEAIIGVNKPPGMVVHPAPGRWHGTLVNALLYRWGLLEQMGNVRPGIVHRLDRDTSGLMVVAKMQPALDNLARQFHGRTVSKCYLAIVRGVVRRDSGTIDLPIGRHQFQRHKMSVKSRRSRTAVTHYKVKERLKGATVLEVRPQTGRTHQIRVHLAAIGFPILGDATYGRKSPQPECLSRQALHALSLSFDHPESGERQTLRAPLWPDLVSVLKQLRVLGVPRGAKQ